MSQSDSTNKYNLVLCELFNRNIHGLSSDEIQTIDGHYLIINKFDGATRQLLITEEDDDDYDDDDDDLDASFDDSIYSYSTLHNGHYNNMNFAPHIILRNYVNIISRPTYIKPEIAECIVLPSQHNIAIIKTIWIKLIQRRWKRLYAKRTQIIKKRCNVAALYNRELTGRWPQDCDYLPTIYGMLFDLK